MDGVTRLYSSRTVHAMLSQPQESGFQAHAVLLGTLVAAIPIYQGLVRSLSVSLGLLVWCQRSRKLCGFYPVSRLTRY